MVIEAVGMFIVNFGIVAGLLLFDEVLGLVDRVAPLHTTLFYVFLFTVTTVLFDRYHTVLRARGVLDRRAREAA